MAKIHSKATSNPNKKGSIIHYNHQQTVVLKTAHMKLFVSSWEFSEATEDRHMTCCSTKSGSMCVSMAHFACPPTALWSSLLASWGNGLQLFGVTSGDVASLQHSSKGSWQWLLRNLPRHIATWWIHLQQLPGSIGEWISLSQAGLMQKGSLMRASNISVVQYIHYHYIIYLSCVYHISIIYLSVSILSSSVWLNVLIVSAWWVLVSLENLVVRYRSMASLSQHPARSEWLWGGVLHMSFSLFPCRLHSPMAQWLSRRHREVSPFEAFLVSAHRRLCAHGRCMPKEGHECLWT